MVSFSVTGSQAVAASLGKAPRNNASSATLSKLCSIVSLRLAHNSRPRDQPYVASEMDKIHLDIRDWSICDVLYDDTGAAADVDQDSKSHHGSLPQ